MGFYIKRKKLALVIYGVMTVGMLMLLIPTLLSETGGNPAIAEMGISQSSGAMAGKEVRFGPAASAYWSTATTIISTGSVNSMHDRAMPLRGAMQLDRKSVVLGKRMSVRLDLGGRGLIKKK